MVQAALTTGYRHVDTAARYANEAEDTVYFCHKRDRGRGRGPAGQGLSATHPTLRTVAAEVGGTPAQVLVRWSLRSTRD